MIGNLLGARYKIIDVLGSGGFGKTFIAEDTQRPGNPKCVVKQLKPASQDPKFLQAARRLFNTEAETLEKLGKHDRIPRLLAYFEEQQEFYLVQEFIEGHTLSEELPLGQPLPEAQVIVLLKNILEVLEYVHAQSVIHRDVKPSNLMRRQSDQKLVLIDFGAVKEIRAQLANDRLEQRDFTLGIGTQGYTPSEQLIGQPRFSSDIYAVGMIGIRALSGLHPSELPQDPDTCEICWRSHAQVSSELAMILDKMVRYHFSERYQSATAVLQALQRLNHGALDLTSPPSTLLEAPASVSDRIPERGQSPRRWHIPVGVAIAAVAVMAGGMLIQNFLPSSPHAELSVAPDPDPVQAAIAERISVGEKILTPGPSHARKREGVDAIAVGAFDQAIPALEAARQADRRDPETLIYLNNARIGTRQAYLIAAAVPLDNTTYSAVEILQGVAQVQNQTNQAGGINGIPLKVAIASDGNQPKVAQQIATTLVNNPTVLGVVGHADSDATLAAAKVYQANQLVMISPLSSAVQLSGFGNYVFRTTPSDLFTARALCTYLLTQLKKPKVAVFFNSKSGYSQSLSKEFRNALFYSGQGQIVADFDLSRPDFSAYHSVKQATQQGAQVIMLAANSDVSDRAIQIVQMNRKRLKVLAGDSIYIPKTLEIGGEMAVGMVLAVPANVLKNASSPFRQQATQLWGDGSSWRAALAYDAAQALTMAIQHDPSRRGIQRSLTATNFSVPGATRPVSFLPTGDREGAVQLVTVVPTKGSDSGLGYRFKPLN